MPEVLTVLHIPTLIPSSTTQNYVDGLISSVVSTYTNLKLKATCTYSRDVDNDISGASWLLEDLP